MIKVCVFDAYGNLFDVAAAARAADAEPEFRALADVWPQVATDWRSKQLSYTWLRATASQHVDFWRITQDGLDWALEASGVATPALRQRLLDLYWELDAYPEVPNVQSTLKKSGIQTAILSNGTPAMLDAATASAGIGDRLDALLSVEDVGVFKPHSSVYDMVGAQFGTNPDEVMFLSSNGWDAAAASGYGFRTVWVNRAGDPVDRLWAAPDDILTDLSPVPNLI